VVKVVAFYTEGPYEREAERLHHSLERFKLYYETAKIPAISWAEAVLSKPRFILDALRESAADAIFYTDADSEFKALPDWSLFKDCDVSYHKLQRSPIHEVESLTGSMWFRNTPEVRSAVEDWALECQKPHYRKHFTPEQAALNLVWGQSVTAGSLWAGKLRFLQLPPEYVWLEDLREVYGDRAPVIEHRQVSRKYRHAKQEETQGAETKAAEPEKEIAAVPGPRDLRSGSALPSGGGEPQ